MALTGTDSIDDNCRTILEQLYNERESLDFNCISKLLADFKILTRNKSITPEVLDEKCIQTLVTLSSQRQIEAQKCLSNLILNYKHLRDNLIEPYMSCVENRLREALDKHETQKDEHQDVQKHDRELLHYDLRIVFLLSALCPRSQVKMRDRLLNLLLRVTLIEAENLQQHNHMLVIESLKSIFNLTMEKCTDTKLIAKLIKKLYSLVGTAELIEIESQKGAPIAYTDRLLVNLTHLLTNMPEEVYLDLSNEDVDKILNSLDEELKTHSKESSFGILPLLNTCTNICQYKRDVCQRWFDEIIGSTKEFDKRPEEYDTLRGRLVKLMTSVDVHIKEIAAEFLFVLCGHDTEKFITYTGFGNSAAFLASKGLIFQSCGRGAESADKTAGSSSQDHKMIREKLDPITGKLEKPKKDPMAGMSVMEKEWHAHELVEAISKLSGLGVIKPMQVGPDGKMSDLLPRTDDEDLSETKNNGNPK